MRNLTKYSIALAAIALSACQLEDEPLLCTEPPPVVDKMALACPEPDPESLEYVMSGDVFDLLFRGRSATLSELSADSYFDVVWVGELVRGDFVAKTPALSLFGGPCSSGCNTTMGILPNAVTEKEISIGQDPIRNFSFQATPQVCVPDSGHLEIPAGAFQGWLGLERQENAVEVYAFRVANTKPASLTVDFDSRRFAIEAEFCSFEPTHWGARLKLEATIENVAPVADAGPDQILDCETSAGTTVSLDGSQSSDADGDSLEYRWWLGPARTGIKIREYSSAPSATMAIMPSDATFTLVVRDDGNWGHQSRDSVRVTVRDNCP